MTRRGPLAGIRVVELAGMGPGPFAATVLADLGADVLRIERLAGTHPHRPSEHELLHRSRRSVALDLKQPAAVDVVMWLCDRADVVLEGFRPGVVERLGLGPEQLLERNPRLVYGRVTGWGQDGPRASDVGHDINYLSVSGALSLIGEAGGRPVPPLNLVADFGAGGMFLVAGVLAALIERATSGLGQVVDAAMVDGTAMLLAMTVGFRSAGLWRDERGANSLDGGAPFYGTYQCADGGYLAVGAIEPAFYAAFLHGLAQEDPEAVGALPPQLDKDGWPTARASIALVIARRSRAQWLVVFDGTDACVTPVLTLEEAARDEHLARRGTYLPGPAGGCQPAPAPRFSRSTVSKPSAPTAPGADTLTGLAAWGIPDEVISRLLASGAAVQR